MLALVRDNPDLDAPLVTGLPYLKAEAVYAVRQEMARNLADVLERRTRARLLARDASADAAAEVARLIAPELGWSEETARAEADAYRALGCRRRGLLEHDAILAVAVGVLAASRRARRRARGSMRRIATDSGRPKSSTRPSTPPDHHHVAAVARDQHHRFVELTVATASSAERSRYRSIGGCRRELELAMIRRPAEDPSLRIGALVTNYGGPGQGGVAYLPRTWTRIPPDVRARFDLVSWDPRGTGDSRPVDCVDDAFLEASELAGRARLSRGARRRARYNDTFAQGCASAMGPYAGQVGTRNTARDLEAIRRALGEPMLNYLGYSYGTVVGAVYAQMFPSTIRAMVLDGPADWWAPRIDYSYAQALGFKQALDTFLGWCESTRVARSGRREHHATCSTLLTPAQRPRRCPPRTRERRFARGLLTGSSSRPASSTCCTTRGVGRHSRTGCAPRPRTVGAARCSPAPTYYHDARSTARSRRRSRRTR